MGIENQVANWIESRLSDKGQRVVIYGKYSGWSEVSSGETQGSALGSIIFVLFIEDIEDVEDIEDRICGNILKIAGHTKLFCKVGCDINCAKLRADLMKLYN